MTEPSERARIPLWAGFIALAALIGGLGYWSVSTKISGAIIASGTVKVKHERQVVQHLDGGIVERILVRNGDTVHAGTPLIELNSHAMRAELAIVTGQLSELLIRKARLMAEQREHREITFPASVLDSAAADRDLANQILEETTLFEARKNSYTQEENGLREQVAQTKAQIVGLEAQLGALQERSALVSVELVNKESLFEMGLTNSASVLGLQSDVIETRGQIGKLLADVAALKGRVEEFLINIAQARATRIETAISQSRELRFREIELNERKATLAERLERMVIKAPVAGVIFDLRVFAEGSVVRPAEELLYILPDDQPLVVGAHIEPINIDQIEMGQLAVLRLSAFDQRTTPDLDGFVTLVSPDAIKDQATGQLLYPIELTPSEDSIELLGDLQLLPGMPIEVFVTTEERTPLAFLTKPLVDYFERAFRAG